MDWWRGWKGNWGGTEAVEAEPTKADGTSIPSQCGIGVSYGSEGGIRKSKNRIESINSKKTG